MSVLLANRAQSTLAAPISAASLSLVLQGGTEGRFPTPGVGEWFPLTVVDADGSAENMRVTARDGVTLTVLRAQEGSFARAFPAGAKADLRLTVAALFALHADASTITEGQLPVGVMPAHLQATLSLVASADLQAVSGYFRTDGTTLGLPPGATVGVLLHNQIAADTAYQFWRNAATMDGWQRVKAAGVWSAWASAEIYLPLAGGTLTGALTLAAPAADLTPLRMPHGIAPAAPPDGGLWTTSDGLFARIAGVTRQMAHLAANVFIGKQTFAASTVDNASINIDDGVAPTAPVNGDVWLTATQAFIRLDSVTYSFALSGANSFTGKQTFAASVSGASSINIPHGGTPAAPVNGDMWTETDGFYVRIDGVTQSYATTAGLVDADWQAGTETDKAVVSPAQISLALDAHVYAGSTNANLNFPVGTVVMAFKTGTPTNRAGNDVVRLATGNTYQYTVDGAGDALLGTWRSRGAIGATDTFALYERVS